MTTISYEFFPPRDLDGSFRLWECAQTLRHTDPRFVSVTYGAGGTTRALTHEAVAALTNRLDLDVAAHLTCVEATKTETLEVAQGYADAGVRRVVALRGDMPGGGAFVATEDGFSSSVDLIEALSGTGRFEEIWVGAYPDPHPEAQGDDSDIDWLRRKADAGATGAITQFFFLHETFLRFRDRVAAAGIDIELVPGILPIQSWAGARRFAERCGAPVPEEVALAFETAERDNRVPLLATAIATELCTDLIEEGVEHLHFYTLNRPELTRDVIRALGLAPDTPLAQVA